EVAGIREDGELISREGPIGEDVAHDVADRGAHGPPTLGRAPSRHQRGGRNGLTVSGRLRFDPAMAPFPYPAGGLGRHAGGEILISRGRATWPRERVPT